LADTYSYQIEVSANAGMDMFMVPNAYQTLDNDLNTMVNNGVVPMSRVNDAVRRILTQKFELGLFEDPFTNRSHMSQIGDAAHRAVAARAAGEGDVGQTGYAQNGDIANLDLTPADHTAVDTVCHAMPLRGPDRLRATDDDHRPVGRDRRSGRLVAARYRGRGRGRRPVRLDPVPGTAAAVMAADAEPGADQRR
jgi:hypothetical protein